MQLLNVLPRLQRRGYHIRLVSMLSDQPLAQEFEKAGIKVDGLGMRRGVPDIRGILRLRKLWQAWRPDIVHAHMVHANLLARVTRLVCRVPILMCSAHSTYEMHTARTVMAERTWREWAYRLTDSLCDLTTQVCREGLERYAALKAARRTKLRLLPNGVDCTKFRRDEGTRIRTRRLLGIGEEFLWTAAGRLVSAKDYPTMLRAFRLLDGRNAKLVIAGSGPQLIELQKLARDLGLGGSVIFVGALGDVSDLLGAADGFVLSSSYEGLPLALLEAAAAQLPIVATDVGGVTDIVQNGHSALLVPPGRPQALARAMSDLMALDISRRRFMGSRARETVKRKFEISLIVDQLDSIYRGFRRGLRSSMVRPNSLPAKSALSRAL